MKILAVAHDSNLSGGANRSLLMVLKNLKEIYDADITVLVPRKEGAFNHALDGLNIKYFSYPYWGVISGIRNDGRDFVRQIKVYLCYAWEKILANFIKQKLKGKKFDIVYTNTRLPYVGAEIAKLLKIPHVCHVREYGLPQPLWGCWTYQKMYDMSDKIICISDALHADFAKNVSDDKLVTIHNAIEPSYTTEPGLKKNKKTFDLIHTGRLVPDKGHTDSIGALDILKKKGYTDIVLHIVGSSPPNGHLNWYSKKLNEYIAERNLEDNVVLHGEVDNMGSIRSDMDIELVCSIFETFGRVTVEGMRAGLLVIGSNTGATPEIIEDMNTGVLYEQGNCQDLADKIEYMYLNRQTMTEIARRGSEYSKTHFLPEDNARKIYDVLTAACN